MIRVSLVVSTLGRTVQLERLLQSLVLQAFQDFEVVIVDQNADDRLKAIVEAYCGRLDIVRTTSARGVSRGRNSGLAIARGDIVAFPDDDCWYPVSLLQDVVALFDARPELDLVSGRTVDASLADSLGSHLKQRQPIRRHNIWRIGNSNTIFLRAQEHLYFDETLGVGCPTEFQSGEETDFLLRLLKRHLNMEFHPALLVHHDQVDLRGAEDGVARARQYAPGQGRVLRLHGFGPATALWFALRPVARACVAAATGDVPLARYKLAWAHGVAAGYLAPVPRTAARELQSTA